MNDKEYLAPSIFLIKIEQIYSLVKISKKISAASQMKLGILN